MDNQKTETFFSVWVKATRHPAYHLTFSTIEAFMDWSNDIGQNLPHSVTFDPAADWLKKLHDAWRVKFAGEVAIALQDAEMRESSYHVYIASGQCHLFADFVSFAEWATIYTNEERNDAICLIHRDFMGAMHVHHDQAANDEITFAATEIQESYSDSRRGAAPFDAPIPAPGFADFIVILMDDADGDLYDIPLF